MEFTLKRKVFKIFGAEIRLYDESGSIKAFAKAKAFKLKEDVAIYTDETTNQLLASIKARNIIDISATYDVFSADNLLIGSLSRKGIKAAFLRDEWLFKDASGNVIGSIKEDSGWMGFLRRYVDLVSMIFPQVYTLTYNNRELGVFKRTYNLIAVRYNISFIPGAFESIDQRLAFASVILLSVIDASKQ